MSIADQTDLQVTAELLRAGLLPAEDAPPYPREVLEAAVAKVALQMTRAPFERKA
ncbi:hypothetical protein ACUXK4_004504 [Methylorubrum extorquens]